MSCNCPQPQRAADWTPNPEARSQPTEILPGENIDCYMARAGNVTGNMDDKGEELKDKIANTSITSDLNGKVSETFTLTEGSSETNPSWRIFTNGTPGLPAGFGPTFNTSTGVLSGTVTDAFLNKQYEIEIQAVSSGGAIVDSRKFWFFPKKEDNEPKGDTVKFVFPYAPQSKAVITSGYGPRSSGPHFGLDIAQPGRVIGTILAAADGEVIRNGPGRGWGNVIFIAHKNASGKVVATTVYGHWSESYVQVGQKVAAGQAIAKEGNTGVSRGPHLHFEMHLANFKKPVDPLPYIRGQVLSDAGGAGGAVEPSGSLTTVTNTNSGITTRESDARTQVPCADPTAVTVADPSGGTPTHSYAGPVPGNPGAMLSPEPSDVVRPTNTAAGAAYDAVKTVLDADSRLNAADKKHLLFVAKIESSFNPSAANPTSSAKGLFQMTDSTAGAYYKQIGALPTEANRNDPTLATKAQVEFYLREQKPYWNEYQASGGTKIAGKTLSPAVQAKYVAMGLNNPGAQNEFIYGLIQHDGIGNAIRGNDHQGIDYYRRKIRG